ncbi:hypothetical protein IV454_26030 [Massilia antarctica]|uniref:Uncharacterized protein n=1 Tax=Massilia antarctica TaxID=2765360 RepID=A0AA49A7A0_9BURK|nr:hypothetical protein [Massilia antarctica]QPI48916.1 hypothetical protein IV454_26030 [Massilia antarctica]
MALHSRETLKRLFQKGAMPAQDAFGALIESMLNIVDQQFDKNAHDGLKVGQIGQGRLMSFYHDIADKSAIWSVRMDKGGTSLVFGTGGPQPADGPDGATGYRKAMALSPAGAELRFATLPGAPRTATSQFELDLQGRIVADGRIGRACTSVPADGHWHDVTSDLTGCQAFEVMAGAGKRDSGKYALLHAYALSAFQGGKNEITCHQAHYGSKCSRLELRWFGAGKAATSPYRLQIRTGCAYDSDDTTPAERTAIRVYLTQLWFDPAMKAGWPKSARGGQP